MRELKTLLSTTALLAGLAMAPVSQAQISVGIGIQPVCSYGYYGYAPYACAPMGFYGPGYFYNGIFLGMGPWGGWGYSHGWGSHRFSGEGGGNYHGGPGAMSYRGHAGGGAAVRGGGVRAGSGSGVHSNPAVSHGGGARPSAAHVSAPRGGGAQAHAAAPRGGGGGGHAGGGGEHAGGGHR